jgi:hypothetical protein
MEALQTARPKIHEGHRIYALLRMRLAIDRAIRALTVTEKEKAARWAAAWGEAGGIPCAQRKQDA